VISHSWTKAMRILATGKKSLRFVPSPPQR